MTLDAVAQFAPTLATPLFAKHGIDRLFTALGIGPDARDLFGAPAKAHHYEGDVHHAKDVVIEPDDLGVYVIDGSLRVDGTLSLSGHDAYSVLVVTGDLEAANVLQEEDVMLIVLGETRAKNLVYVSPSDAGFVHFAEGLAARDVVSAGSDVESDLPRFGAKPAARVRARDEWSAKIMKAAGSNGPDVAFLRRALTRGDALFEGDGARAKVPSKAALAKMSVTELLGVRGFASAQIDTVVNPNYLTKGDPAQGFDSIVLMNDTVVEAFPPALATLRSLKILGYSEAGPLARMLDSLGTLTGLRELIVADTALTALPEAIGALASLEHLEVRGNANLTTLPESVAALRALRSIHLTDNALQTLPVGLAGLPRLEKIVVREDGLVWPPALAKVQAAARPR